MIGAAFHSFPAHRHRPNQPFSLSCFMKTPPLRLKLAAWLHAHRPLRWVETIVADYSAWSPW
jgi:hypothetical protein